MKILGIQRAVQFSPNHTGNDHKIFTLTKQALEKKGVSVRVLTEEAFYHTNAIDEKYIFSMVRNNPNVRKLQELQEEGRVVINSARGIENCFRTNMVHLLSDKIPQPETYILDVVDNPDEIFERLGNKSFWIKRGDHHAVHKEDVVFCRNDEEGRSILKEFAIRGISNVAISEHLQGDLIKFYAIRGTDFFHWFYPFEENHVKFETPTDTKHYSFDENKLKTIAAKSAELLDIHIYGGDAIISDSGEIQIIDLNDWPSFAPCRDEAATYIAESILGAINNSKI